MCPARGVGALVRALLRPESPHRVVREPWREAEQVDASNGRRRALVTDATGLSLREDELHLARDRTLEFRESIVRRERAVVDRAVQVVDRRAVEQAHDVEP